jgi:hypothetical protein
VTDGGGVAVVGVDGTELLGQVLGEIADAPAGVFRSGDDALGIEPGTGPGDVQRLVVRADGIKAAPLRSAARRCPRRALA